MPVFIPNPKLILILIKKEKKLKKKIKYSFFNNKKDNMIKILIDLLQGGNCVPSLRQIKHYF